MDLNNKLQELIADWETEVVEFKEGGDGYSTEEMGKYFSALSNEANLRGIDSAWLIFGVRDKSHTVVGTNYRKNKNNLQSIKHDISQNTTNRLSFVNVHEFEYKSKRVIMFEIPSAPLGQPIAYKGFYYARAGESLISLDLSKMDKIRAQYNHSDWSAEVVKGATIEDLDQEALRLAKRLFAKKLNVGKDSSINDLTDNEFMTKLHLTTETGGITRAALLLLGKPESSILLTPYPAIVSWIVKGDEHVYEHFGLPFLTVSTRVWNKIRNGKIRIFPANSLVPEEVDKYDERSIHEAIHNAIAHQDYSLNGRINVLEFPDRLEIENSGDFYEGEPYDYVLKKKSARYLRNSLLATTMMNLNLIDTTGFGISEIFKRQAENYLPLPTYELLKPEGVKLTVFGDVIDTDYSAILIDNPDLKLADVVILDALQKGNAAQKSEITSLKEQGLVIGNYPAYRLKPSKDSSVVIGNKNIDVDSDDYLIQIVKGYVKEYGSITRAQANSILEDKLAEYPTKQQRIRKVGNLLVKMRKLGIISNIGKNRGAKWV